MALALQEVLSLSNEERLARETKQGFKSLGSICQEFYETIDPERFKTTEEIKQFVEQHSNYLQLIPEENGEYTLEVLAYDNPYRYLANENGEIIVGENICKVTEESVIDVKTESVIAFSPAKNAKTKKHDNIQKTSAVYGPKLVNSYFYADPPPQSGSNRLVVKFTNDLTDVNAVSGSIIVTYMRIQPYHRTMGVWFQCNRTLGYDYAYKGVLWIGCPTTGHNSYYYGYGCRTNYPILESKNFTTSSPQRILEDYKFYTVCSTWDANFAIDASYYRFKGWSGDGLSKEWREGI